MDLAGLVNRIFPFQDGVEARIRELAHNSDRVRDSWKALGLKISAEAPILLPLAAFGATITYYSFDFLLYNPGPVPQILAGAIAGGALRGFCFTESLSPGD